MRLTFFLFICFNFSFCFAQTNPMKYFYKDRKEEAIPDFAALAVLEKQQCPPEFDWGAYYITLPLYDKMPICTSRYHIISILDAASDTLRKEYLEVKEKPVLPNYRHRPMLIFGKYNESGTIQIEKYEETREYFDDFTSDEFPSYRKICIENQGLEFISLLRPLSEIYFLHSIGTPYYNFKNLDSIDMIFFNDFFIPKVKIELEAAGKEPDEFYKLWLRLALNRTSIKASKIKNGFVSLGAIISARHTDDSKRVNFYELNLAIETVIKNDAKIDSNIVIFIDRELLPPSWNYEQLLNSMCKSPFYFFGSLKGGSLIIDSLVSTRDAFVFGDMIYDISMGLPFMELVKYFLPSNISIDEFVGVPWRYILNEMIPKWKMFDYNRKQVYSKVRIDRKIESLFFTFFSMDNLFRCRRIALPEDRIYSPQKESPKEKSSEFPWLEDWHGESSLMRSRSCHMLDLKKDEGVWGKR